MYEREIEEEAYLKSVEPIARQLKHITFCFDTFLVAHEMAKEYLGTVHNLSSMARSAFTKAILVDYCNPFMKNEFEEGKKIIVSTKYLFKSNQFDKDFHEALTELRHQLVAHGSFEHPSLHVTTMKYDNTRPEPNTHTQVTVPAQYFLQNTSMLFIDDLPTLERIVRHVEICKDLTMQKARELVDVLKEKMLAFAPVAGSASFTSPLNNPGTTQFSAKSESDPLDIEPRELNLKIGRTNVQFTVTRVRMDRLTAGKFEGPGFRITAAPNPKDTSSIDVTVQFLPMKDDQEAKPDPIEDKVTSMPAKSMHKIYWIAGSLIGVLLLVMALYEKFN